jgi:NADH:ubiquinone oxidoreductase subunit H
LHNSRHLFKFFVDPVIELFPLLLQAALVPVKKPRDDLGVLELHIRLLDFRALDLDHVDLIHLLFYLFDLFIQAFLLGGYQLVGRTHLKT